MTNKQYTVEITADICGNCINSFTTYDDNEVNCYCQKARKEVRYYSMNCLFLPSVHKKREKNEQDS